MTEDKQTDRNSHELTVEAGRRAFDLFCTPSQSSRRAPDHDTLVQRARHHLRSATRARIATTKGHLQIYRFVPDTIPLARVLLVHGWTGEAAFMAAFGDYLRRRGFEAVLMDLPAHGESEGDWASLFDCAQAVLEVAEAFAPVRFALGHSIGAMALLTAGEGHAPLPRAYPFEAYVLVAMPDLFADVTKTFGDELGLAPPALRNFEQRLEALAHRSIDAFTGSELLSATGRPTLLIHSRDDDEVPFTCAEAMTRRRPDVVLEAVDGLGHRAILYAPPAIRAAASFLLAKSEQRPAQGPAR